MKKVLPHIILIPLLLSVPVVSSPDFDGTLSVFRVSPFQREFIRFVLVIFFFYLNLNLFLPKFYSKNKFPVYALCILVSFGLMVVLPDLLTSGTAWRQGLPPAETGYPVPSGNRRRQWAGDSLFRGLVRRMKLPIIR